MSESNLERQRLDRVLEIAVGAWAIFCLHYLCLGRFWTASLDLMVAGVILALRFQTRKENRADKFLGVCLLGLFLAALFSGQSRSLAIWYIVGTPVAAGFLLGTKGAMKWSGWGCLAILGIDFSESVVRLPPEFVPEGLELTAGRIVLVLVLLAFTLAFRHTTEDHLRDLERQGVELESARKTSLEASESKSRFLGVASHEFRTPLNSILGFSQMLLDETGDSLTPKQAQYCKRLSASATRLHHLLQACFEYSALEPEQTVFLPTKIEPMFRQLEEEFAFQAEERNLALMWNVEPTDLQVLTDRSTLIQLLRQLVSNAIKFSEQKGDVWVRGEVDPQGRVLLLVRDNGPGIAPEYRERIFEPLYQMDSSLNRARGGLGLGLAIAKQCADRLQMKLRLESTGEVSRGSTFILEFEGKSGS